MLYRDAGVDIDAATKAKASIKLLARKTFNARVLKEVGAFGGFFSIKGLPRDAVLISSIDGVGTKLKIAFAMKRHTTVGADLVNHCVNDVCGKGEVVPARLPGNRQNASRSGYRRCARRGLRLSIRWLCINWRRDGGDAGFYRPNEYDLAACIIGWVRQREIIDGSRISPGDAIVGLPPGDYTRTDILWRARCSSKRQESS